MTTTLPTLRIAALLAALAAAPAAAQTAGAAPPAPAPPPAPVAAPQPAPRPADVASVDSLVAALYSVISGPAGRRDWDRFRALFAPGARIIFSISRREGEALQRAATVESYIASNGPFMERFDFHEREVARRTERFGNVAHVWGTFEYETSDPARPRDRGINSIQLVYADGRWWVMTLLTAAERPWHPLPAEYLRSTP
jgi:hypothetical protein